LTCFSSSVLIAVLEQHGFEDAWVADGEELVKMGNYLIQNVASFSYGGNMSGWTVFLHNW